MVSTEDGQQRPQAESDGSELIGKLREGYQEKGINLIEVGFGHPDSLRSRARSILSDYKENGTVAYDFEDSHGGQVHLSTIPSLQEDEADNLMVVVEIGMLEVKANISPRESPPGAIYLSASHMVTGKVLVPPTRLSEDLTIYRMQPGVDVQGVENRSAMPVLARLTYDALVSFTENTLPPLQPKE